jgi:alpha-L-arabinofuranosidase
MKPERCSVRFGPFRVAGVLLTLVMPPAIAGCNSGGAQRKTSRASDIRAASGITNVAITNKAIQNEVKRLGINLGGQDYYDSGQMLKDLVFTNPGFEGETWQAILHCEGLSNTSCTDPNQWNQWPADFLKGAQFEFISGAAAGVTGTVLSSLAASPREKDQGVMIRYAPLAKAADLDDFVLVRQTIPGNAQAGWWTNAYGGGSFATEFTDLAPNSPGKQALKLLASGPGQVASVSSYFDTLAGHSFVQLKGSYRISFRAKGLAGKREVNVTLQRSASNGLEKLFAKTVPLTDSWRDYSFNFTAAEDGAEIGSVGLTFDSVGTDMLLDDVSLTPVAVLKDNPTVFRDEVVDTLRQLHPGLLRYQDGDHLGSSIDNMIASPFARVRAGFSEGGKQQDMVPVGLHEFLQLCKAVNAEPWFNMPSGISQSETRNLIEYLSGPSSSIYGAKRAALGQVEPWTSIFPIIHLELGNEEWNAGVFAGAAMSDPVAYGRRAKEIFLAARNSPYYQANKFDLVIGTFTVVPDWTQKELANSGGYDTTAVAPYSFDRFDDASSDEAIFGPMMAEPEMLDSTPTGYMTKQAQVARSAAHPANLSVYEVNLGTASGSVDQDTVTRTVASMGAGLALIDHMLLMMRDVGVKSQMVWALSGYSNSFQNSMDHKPEKTPLFGTVVDMGGQTNLRRPQFLAEELANTAILPTMLATHVTDANPTWDQPKSANDDVRLEGAHFLQTFAFADGARRSVVVLNLSRTDAIPLKFSGVGAPVGSVQVSRLTSTKITDTNEERSHIAISDEGVHAMSAGATQTMPPFSMTVYRWTVGR